MSLLQHQLIQELMERTAQARSPVLSIYLSIDPADRDTRRGGYKLALEKMLKDLEASIEDPGHLQHFQEDAAWVRQKVELHLPKGKSLAAFVSPREG